MQAGRPAQPSAADSPSSSHPRKGFCEASRAFRFLRCTAARVAPEGVPGQAHNHEPRGSAPRERDHRGGDHPVPSRTRQLSPPSPRVLQRKAAGGQGVALAEGAFLCARAAAEAGRARGGIRSPRGPFLRLWGVYARGPPNMSRALSRDKFGQTPCFSGPGLIIWPASLPRWTCLDRRASSQSNIRGFAGRAAAASDRRGSPPRALYVAGVASQFVATAGGVTFGLKSLPAGVPREQRPRE